MPLAVLDASVAVRWLVPEVGSAEARALLQGDWTWTAPRLLTVEVASALRRKAAADEIRQGVASEALAALCDAVDDGLVQLARDEQLVPAALLLALRLDHKLPDCLYLALAQRQGCTLVTADRRLGGIAGAQGVAVHLVPSP